MQTTVNLQEPYRYTPIPLLCIIVIAILVAIGVCLSKKLKTKPEIEEIKVKEIPEKNIKNISLIKKKYLKQLEDIERSYNSNKIQLRQAYQSISEAVRMFIFEVTDISTHNYSLIEIKNLNMPVLYELIAEFYEPEFASKSVGDFKVSISKAKNVIMTWKES